MNAPVTYVKEEIACSDVSYIQLLQQFIVKHCRMLILLSIIRPRVACSEDSG